MAKKSDGPPPSGPTAAAGTEAEPSPATLTFGTTTQASGQVAEPTAATAAVHATGAPADAPPAKKKKKGTSNAELRLMRHLEMRFAALPNDRARRRVFEWMADNYGPESGS